MRLEQAATCAALNLAARCLRHASGFHKQDGVGLHLELFGQRLANQFDERRGVCASTRLQLLHDDKALLTPDFTREGCACARPERVVTLLDGKFQIVWIEIAPANDDKVFDPSGDEQFAVSNEP